MRHTLRIAFLLLLFVAGGCASPRTAVVNGSPDDTLPRYGDPNYETIWSRTPADGRDAQRVLSRDASKRGWSLLLRGGDPTTAMKRFNEAWSLYPKNADALWGMAIVQYERTKQAGGSRPGHEDLTRLDQAVELINEAARLPPPQASLLNDNALLLATRGGMRQALSVGGSKADFGRAERLLRRAETIEVHPLIYETWSALERYRGRSEAAERYDRKARNMRGGPAGG